MRLNVWSFALTCALVWGIGLFVLTLWVILLDGPTGEVTFIGKVYRGYNISIAGGFLGLIWGLADGFVGGAIFAWLYNLLAGKKGRAESL